MLSMKETSLVRLGEDIKHFRKECGLSQEKLAELANLHRTYVGGVERGERNISLLNLVRLANALEVSVADLVEGVEK